MAGIPRACKVIDADSRPATQSSLGLLLNLARPVAERHIVHLGRKIQAAHQCLVKCLQRRNGTDVWTKVKVQTLRVKEPRLADL